MQITDVFSGYVSGGMRGHAQFNFPSFDTTRDYLESLGMKSYSPADNDRVVYPKCEQAPGFAAGDTSVEDPDKPDNYTFRDLLVWDVWAIGHADCIVFLPGWESSTGAKLERHVAEALGKPMFYAVFHDGKCTDIVDADPEV